MKKTLILVKLLLVSVFLFNNLLQAQFTYKNRVSERKVEIYQSIITSDIFKKKKNITLVSIQPIDIDFEAGYKTFAITSIKEVEDTISVKSIQKNLYSNYWIYEEDKYNRYEDIEYLIVGEFFNDTYKTITDYNYIRVFEPLDKWKNLYFLTYGLEGGKPYEIIPVLYTRIKKNKEVEKKYLFFEIVFSKFGAIESLKVVN